ncbi:MAG: helix-turn-helix transcriptional regulator [Ruminococcaceae bacterium]|nr:helix-turn-helix transcriptional regulator [Oscillospiraceae bacterium]
MNKIRKLREAMSLRQIDVANATGIDQKTLSNYETGKTNPDSYALIRLADFFNVSIDYLVGRSFTEKNSKAEIIKKIDSISKELNDIKQLIQ